MRGHAEMSPSHSAHGWETSGAPDATEITTRREEDKSKPHRVYIYIPTYACALNATNK